MHFIAYYVKLKKEILKWKITEEVTQNYSQRDKEIQNMKRN